MLPCNREHFCFMTELTLYPSKKISPAHMQELCDALHLTATMKGSLKSLPDNIHWHYKKGKEKGTLEITLLSETNEIILSCKNNRRGDWIEGAMKELESKLTFRLRSPKLQQTKNK